MSPFNKANTQIVSIERIEAGLRVAGKKASDNPVYLPIFERLLKEREALLARRSSLDLAREWAT